MARQTSSSFPAYEEAEERGRGFFERGDIDDGCCEDGGDGCGDF
jgi:hypothetical protein